MVMYKQKGNNASIYPDVFIDVTAFRLITNKY